MAKEIVFDNNSFRARCIDINADGGLIEPDEITIKLVSDPDAYIGLKMAEQFKPDQLVIIQIPVEHKVFQKKQLIKPLIKPLIRKNRKKKMHYQRIIQDWQPITVETQELDQEIHSTIIFRATKHAKNT